MYVPCIAALLSDNRCRPLNREKTHAAGRWRALSICFDDSLNDRVDQWTATR